MCAGEYYRYNSMWQATDIWELREYIYNKPMKYDQTQHDSIILKSFYTIVFLIQLMFYCCSFFSSPLSTVFIQPCLSYVQLHFSLGFLLLSLCFKQQFSYHFTLFSSNRMKLPIILLCEQKVDSSTLTECNSIVHLLLWCIQVTCCWPCVGCSSASSQVQRLLYMIQSL